MSDNLNPEHNEAEQTPSINWEDRYKAVHGRLAPAQRDLAETRKQLAAEKEARERLEAQLRGMSETYKGVQELAAKKYAAETLRESLTEEELEDLDPVARKAMEATLMKQFYADKSKTSFFDDSTATPVASKTDTTGKSDEMEMRAKARLQRMLTNPDTLLHKAYQNSTDPEFIAFIENDPEFKNQFTNFLNSSDLEQVIDEAPIIEGRLKTFFDTKKETPSDQPKKSDVIDPQTSSTGGSKHLTRSQDEGQIQAEINRLLEQHGRLVRSNSYSSRQQAKEILSKVEVLRNKILNRS